MTEVFHEGPGYGGGDSTRFDLEACDGVLHLYAAASVSFIFLILLLTRQSSWLHVKRAKKTVRLVLVLSNLIHIALQKRKEFIMSWPLLWAVWCKALLKDTTLMTRMPSTLLGSKEKVIPWMQGKVDWSKSESTLTLSPRLPWFL